MMDRSLIRISFFLAVFFLIAGCIREDRSGCSEGVILKFNYVTGTGLPVATDIPETDRISVFIFDENGIFIEEKDDIADGLTTDYRMNLPYYEGRYQFVVWAGLSNRYQLSHLQPGITYIQDFELKLNSTTGHIVSQPPTPLYYGSHPVVSVNTLSTTNVAIGIQKITNHVLVIIHNSSKDPQPQIQITANNGNYNFKGEIIPGNDLIYPPYNLQYSEPTASWHADFTLMRLQTDCQARLIIQTEPDKPEYNEDLIKGLLQANPSLDFNTDHDFIIEITFDGSSIPVSILINGWEIVNEEI